MALVYEINRKACEIYLAPAEAGSSAPAFFDVVGEFMNTVQGFPPNSPGEHALLWPCFLVALEISVTGHRLLFQILLKYRTKRGFTNLYRAIEYLERIWVMESDPNWVIILTEFTAFVG